uniref:Histone PARylation factor 1 n=1 Tax=Ciona savignyi TaxID=51511 RepID=H2YYQ8_CIOSA
MPKKRKSFDLPEKSSKSAKKHEENDTDLKERIEKLYGIPFQQDFYDFWKLCIDLKSQNPLDCLLCVGLRLVGPFYYLHHIDKQDTSKPPEYYHLKWRHYYDTPEFLTLLISTRNKGYHVGYFNDDPSDVEAIVASNTAKDGQYTVQGDNLFAAVSSHIQNYLKNANKEETEVAKEIQTKLEKIAQEKVYSLQLKSEKVKIREKKMVVAKSFHKLGIVVPVVNDVGYRPLPHKDNQLEKLFKKITDAKDDSIRMEAFEPIQEMVTFIQFANDECDYGMGLELGIDVFVNGSKYFFKLSNNLLMMAYKLLKRNLYAKIIENHLKDRKMENVDRLNT